LTTGAIADEYVALCQNPLQNLPRWLAENKKPKAHRSDPSTARTIEQISSPRLAGAEGFCEHPLRQMQSRMDADRPFEETLDHLPARPGARAGRDKGLRSLRATAEGSAGPEGKFATGDDVSGEEFGSELAAVDGYYRTRIAAARQSRAPAAVIRAMRTERLLAVRAIRERRQQASRLASDRRMLAKLRDQQTRPILKLGRGPN
jgi:hypothetical protein